MLCYWYVETVRYRCYSSAGKPIMRQVTRQIDQGMYNTGSIFIWSTGSLREKSSDTVHHAIWQHRFPFPAHRSTYLDGHLGKVQSTQLPIRQRCLFKVQTALTPLLSGVFSAQDGPSVPKCKVCFCIVNIS
jgi:hypothetical protein